jgi:hypothetical protein
MSSSDQPPDGLKPEKEIPANLVIPPKKEKLSKAERRALQQQQRAAKAARQDGGGQQQTQQKPPAQPKQQQPKPPSKSADENKVPESTAQTTDDKAPPNKEVSVLSHLPPYRGTSLLLHVMFYVFVELNLVTLPLPQIPMTTLINSLGFSSEVRPIKISTRTSFKSAGTTPQVGFEEATRNAEACFGHFSRLFMIMNPLLKATCDMCYRIMS